MAASHWKFQTPIRQIELHEDTLFGYGNVEQVRLKAIQETPDLVGPAVWVTAGETLQLVDKYIYRDRNHLSNYR